MRLTFEVVALLAAVLSAIAQALSTNDNSIEFGDLKCKLPGWPGHPAPSCEPSVPNQCCAGTKCLPDPFDATHNTCQQMNSISMAERALTASALTSHVENLLGDAISMLNLASTSLYLAGKDGTTTNNEAILERAKSLVTENHGNVKTGPKDQSADDWHKYAHGGGAAPVKNNMRNPAVENKKKDAPAPADGQSQGGFDYSQYYGGGSKGSGSSSGGGASSQGGFDYSKYMPKNIPNSNNGDDKKKDTKKKDTKGHSLDAEVVDAKAKAEPADAGVHHGNDKPSSDEKQHGGYDYSPYYPVGGDPHKRGNTRTFAPVRDDGDDASDQKPAQGGFDYSQYWPMQKSKTTTVVENVEDENDDFIRRAAFELLEADAQVRTASVQARRDVLERAKAVLARLEARIDRELADEISQNPSYTSNRATESPTLVWNDPRDPWSKYIPKMPNYGPNNNNNNDPKSGGVKYNSGDRRPGSLGGPCGQTSYRDFGPCLSKDLTCEGLDAQRPGLCQMRKADAVVLSRNAALDSLRLAEEASLAIRAAAVELIVGSVQPTKEDAVESGDATSVSDLTFSLNQTSLDIREYSSGTVAVVLLGFAVLGYFCWMNGIGKRRSYQSIDTAGATGAGWGSRA